MATQQEARLRVFPQLAPVDPRFFATDVGAIERAVAAPMRVAEGVEESGARRRTRESERRLAPRREEVATLELAEAVETFPESRAARAAARRRGVAESELGTVTAEIGRGLAPQRGQVQELELAEAVETFPEARSVRAGQRRQAISQAELGTVRADTERALTEETRDLERSARILQLEADRQAAGTRTLENLRARQRRVRRAIDTPEGPVIQEGFVTPSGDFEIIREERPQTPSQAAAAAEAATAQRDYTAARAEAARRGRPTVTVSPDRPYGGPLRNVVVTITDPITGEVETQRIPIAEQSGAGGFMIPGTRTAAPTATANPAPVAAPAVAPAPQPAPAPTAAVPRAPSTQAIAYLRANPQFAAQFDQHYGTPGMAAAILGAQ